MPGVSPGGGAWAQLQLTDALFTDGFTETRHCQQH